MTLFFIYLAVAIGVSFLCSLLEAALLSVPRSHVAVMTERGSKAGQRLQVMKDDVDRPLAAILTLNTFAHTLGAAGVGAQATLIWGEAWVGAVSVVVTLAILIFSEIIPKTLGAVNAKRLAGFTAYTVYGMIVMLYPIVAACDWISKLLSGRRQQVPLISREEMHSLAQLAHEEGAIDQNEARILRNLIALREATVEQVMTPRTVAFTLPGTRTVAEVLDGEPPRFARIPITGDSIDDIRGLVHRHALFEAESEGRGGAALAEIARPVHIVPESARLAAVLQQFIDRREHLFVVVDEYGGTAGIVSLEDVLETLLGVEIVDETDSVEDMQKLARQLLNSRRMPRRQ
jgi:CBS domain containing-hemolysin-like protein